MAARKSKGRAKRRSGFLPEGAGAWLHRSVVRILGVAVLLAVGIVAVALATFDPADPSFNTVANRPVTNAVGPFGASLADMLMQSVGAGVVLPLAVVALWGVRMLLLGSSVTRLWLRLSMLLVGALLMSVALGWLPKPAGWAHVPGATLGGVAGEVLLARLAELAAPWAGPSMAPQIPAVLAGLLAVVLAAFTTGLTGSELSRASVGLRRTRDAIGQAGAAVGQVRGRLRSLGGEAGGAVAAEARREPQLGAAPTRRRPTKDIVAPAAEHEDDLDDDDDDDIKVAPPAAARRVPNIIEAPEHPAPTRRTHQRQRTLDLEKDAQGGYELPPLGLLSPTAEQKGVRLSDEALAGNARLLESVLQDFGVHGEIVKVRPGPVVTLYELEPAPGTKTSRVIGLADDIARSMSALSVRIAVIPGRSVIGIELPNAKREMVYLRELLASDAFEKTASALTLVLGKDIGGAPVMVDLARMPHLLIAGTTGSGKSVAVNTMILSLLYRLRPEECRLIMIDPKMLELSVYEGIPHLLAPVVTEPGKAVVALKWAVREMESRYRAMSQLGVRNIAGYNQRLAEARAKGETLSRTVQTGFDPDSGKPVYEQQELDLEALPFIVVIVDEMADLMLVAGKEIEAAVQRLAQMARAAGIHLIMATQRPSVDVITGTIKANFPTRISFQVTSKIDSRTILGEQGAEQLLGQGDMLYMAPGGRIIRVHGPFVSDREVEEVVEHLRAQGEPAYVEEVTEEDEAPAMADGDGGGSGDELYDQAVALVAREGKASTSFVQRHLQIGYNRAARIIERMEAEGVVSRANHVGKREVLVRSGVD